MYIGISIIAVVSLIYGTTRGEGFLVLMGSFLTVWMGVLLQTA